MSPTRDDLPDHPQVQLEEWHRVGTHPALRGRGSRRVRAIRIKVGKERPAPQPDPLGRSMLGFRDGLTTNDLWERGRGVWKMRADNVVEAALVILAHDGIVRLVGTVHGLRIHDDRLALDGRPMPDHPLIGHPDPLDNDSQNPIAYGQVDDGAPDHPRPPRRSGEREPVSDTSGRVVAWKGDQE